MTFFVWRNLGAQSNFVLIALQLRRSGNDRMSDRRFDRAREDVGNIILLEHLNLTVPDPQTAHLFYVSALGFTRDPYMDFGTLGISNFWVNAGETQFHLPKGAPQVFRGTIEVMLPDLKDLRLRLDRVGRQLKDTCFGWEVCDDHLAVVCPWGNQFRCIEPPPDSRSRLGIRSLVMNVPAGTAAGIGRFYRHVLGARSHEDASATVVEMGTEQTVRFVEIDNGIPAYDGHHIAIYVADFSTPHGWLAGRELITEESDQHQYRFQTLVDPGPGGANVRVELEHEVRSLRHPMYGRHLVNRNPGQHFFSFHRGREAFVP
jgi:catechol 2,3-dioxygenase-like lactoylglutathione lyase family enzyme